MEARTRLLIVDDDPSVRAMLREYLRKEIKALQENNIAFKVIGRIEALGPAVRRELLEAIEATRRNSGLLFNIALSYGGRAEIVDACNRILRDRAPDAPIEGVEGMTVGRLRDTIGGIIPGGAPGEETW